jgi:hypothetical protein
MVHALESLRFATLPSKDAAEVMRLPVGTLAMTLQRRLLTLPSKQPGKGRERRLSVIEIYQIALFNEVATLVRGDLSVARVIVDRLATPSPGRAVTATFPFGNGRSGHERLRFHRTANELARAAQDLADAPAYYLRRGDPGSFLFIYRDEFSVGDWPQSPSGPSGGFVNLTQLFSTLDEEILLKLSEKPPSVVPGHLFKNEAI